MDIHLRDEPAAVHIDVEVVARTYGERIPEDLAKHHSVELVPVDVLLGIRIILVDSTNDRPELAFGHCIQDLIPLLGRRVVPLALIIFGQELVRRLQMTGPENYQCRHSEVLAATGSKVAGLVDHDKPCHGRTPSGSSLLISFSRSFTDSILSSSSAWATSACSGSIMPISICLFLAHSQKLSLL